MEDTTVSAFVAALPGIWIGLLVLCLVAFCVTALLKASFEKLSFWINVSPIIAMFLFLVIFLGSGVEFPLRSAWEWILPKEDNGALRLSFEVTWSTALLGIALGLGLFSWIASFLFKKKPVIPGVMGGALMAYSAVIAAWSSNSAAFSLMAISIAFAGTTYFLQMSVESENDSKRISLFLLPKLLGIFILFLGFTGFASDGLNLDFGAKATAWMNLNTELSSIITAKIFVGLGFLLLLQPIPGAGSLWIPTKTPTAPFSLIALIPIPLATLALLFRMENHFKELDLWVFLVGALFASGFFIVSAQFFQKDLPGMVRNWVSIVPMLIAVILGLAGKAAAYPVLLGWVFFLPLLTEISESGKNATNISLLIFSGLGFLGFFGFFPATGNIYTYASLFERPGFLSGVLFLSLGVGTGLVRIVVLHLMKKKDEEKTHFSSALLFVSALLLMGWFVGGSWSGGFFHDQVDAIEGLKALGWVKEATTLIASQNEANWTNATLVHIAVILISVLIGYLTREVDLNRSFPKLGAWTTRGFGLDSFFQSSLSIGTRASRWVSRSISDTVWERLWPKTGEWALQVFRKTAALSEKTTARLGALQYTKIIDTPAKLVQLIQSGDSHWYLFFCVLCAFITLMHFIKF